MRIFDTKHSFKKEFRRQIRLAVLAAIGFTIAFAWKTAVFDAFQSFISRFLDVPVGHYLSETYTAITITLAGVIIIFITSKLLRDN